MEAAHTVHKRAKQHRRRRGNKRAVERKEGDMRRRAAHTVTLLKRAPHSQQRGF